MWNFPLYELRAYRRIFEEDGFKIIETNHTRFVLDDLREGSSPVYSERRLAILREKENLPYSLYPLRRRCETFSHVLACKCRTFIDSTGRLIEWKPKKFHPIECYKVTSRHGNNYTSGVTIYVSKINESFYISSGIDKEYVQLLNLDGRYYVFAMCDEMQKRTRKKI